MSSRKRRGACPGCPATVARSHGKACPAFYGGSMEEVSLDRNDPPVATVRVLFLYLPASRITCIRVTARILAASHGISQGYLPMVPVLEFDRPASSPMQNAVTSTGVEARLTRARARKRLVAVAECVAEVAARDSTMMSCLYIFMIRFTKANHAFAPIIANPGQAGLCRQKGCYHHAQVQCSHEQQNNDPGTPRFQ